jgi:hypothetical protein
MGRRHSPESLLLPPIHLLTTSSGLDAVATNTNNGKRMAITPALTKGEKKKVAITHGLPKPAKKAQFVSKKFRRFSKLHLANPHL